MATLIVSGGRKITGTHRVSGNKNAALPMIAAALLTSEPVTLTNLPAIDDVERMLDAFFRQLGDMDEAVLMQADVDEGAEVRDIADGAAQDGARLDV